MSNEHAGYIFVCDTREERIWKRERTKEDQPSLSGGVREASQKRCCLMWGKRQFRNFLDFLSWAEV